MSCRAKSSLGRMPSTTLGAEHRVVQSRVVRAPGDDGQLEPVLHADGYVRRRFEAAVTERSGQAVGGGVELGIAHAIAGVSDDQRRSAWVSAGVRSREAPNVGVPVPYVHS